MKKPSSSATRAGFTMVELLVVIAIIALLMGLLLPAVQRVREAANRTACANNLKQIGLAMRAYEVSYGALPPDRVQLGNDPGSATWAVLILPFIEQQQLRDTWDINKPYYVQSDQARQKPVPIYFCPTRRDALTAPGLSIVGDEPVVGDTLGANVPGALGDYACNGGTMGLDTKMIT